jgi:RNA polymerase I specific initiation factor
MYYVNKPTTNCRSTRTSTQASYTMTPFLFASPDGRASSSARRVHLRRLYDILHLSIQRGDLLLAQRSFALLSRCEDIEWAAIWKFGLIILAAADHPDQPPAGNDGNDMLGTPKHIEFLRVMMLRHPEQVRTYLTFFLVGGGGVRVSSFPLLSVSHSSGGPHPTKPKSRQFIIFPLDSANRSCGSWYCLWLWQDGIATPSMN